MTEPKDEGSAQRAQREADEMVVTEDDEKEQQEKFDRTGEPERDALGNQEGAS